MKKLFIYSLSSAMTLLGAVSLAQSATLFEYDQALPTLHSQIEQQIDATWESAGTHTTPRSTRDLAQAFCAGVLAEDWFTIDEAT
jgi:hypothetical protein